MQLRGNDIEVTWNLKTYDGLDISPGSGTMYVYNRNFRIKIDSEINVSRVTAIIPGVLECGEYSIEYIYNGGRCNVMNAIVITNDISQADSKSITIN